MKHACPKCGRPTATRYCPEHTRPTNASRSVNRNNASHMRFRRAVKARDGHRCQVCGTTTDLRACHIIPLHAGGTDDPTNGRTLCGVHDRATDRYAR